MRDDVTFKTKSCEEYEGQLQRVQAQLMLEIDAKENQLERLREDVDKIQVSLVYCVALGMLSSMSCLSGSTYSREKESRGTSKSIDL